jgi:hypothetical protein
MFTMADANQNGELDFCEFVEFYNHTMELRKQYGLGDLPDGFIQKRIDAFIVSRRRKGVQMVKSHSLEKKTKTGGTSWYILSVRGSLSRSEAAFGVVHIRQGLSYRTTWAAHSQSGRVSSFSLGAWRAVREGREVSICSSKRLTGLDETTRHRIRIRVTRSGFGCSSSGWVAAVLVRATPQRRTNIIYTDRSCDGRACSSY